ncbi:MAG: right-handed parallel beta-helix repeat-containing protein [candidate division Zixibacteria bacterium]|nr:right-handed parallel beta-helix repeat-containing protein [Candidatus Tariuqbacter arcticus]
MNSFRRKLIPLIGGITLLLLIMTILPEGATDFSLIPVCLADSSVAGAVSGVWTASMSPFIAIDSIWVDFGQVLTIEPGVEVKFASTNLGFSIYGTLNAEGEENDSIRFTSTNPWPYKGIWRYINFSGPQSSGGSMRYCVVTWGQKGVRIENSSPHLAHCRFYNNSYQGLWALNSSLTVDSCEVFNNDQSGVTIFEGNPTFRGNHSHNNLNNGIIIEDLGGGEITGNCFDYNGNEGIYCYGDCPGVEIGYNIISYNSDYGIRIVDCEVGGYPADIHHNLIFLNVLDGVYSDDSNIKLINNTITHNERDGVFCYSGNITLYNNIIDRNGHRGIYTQSAPVTINYNDVWNNETANYLGCSAGYSDISEDPLYEDVYDDNYQVVWGSPCIDTGNPSPYYNDPDGTRNDMGALFYNQSGVNQPGEIGPPESLTILKGYPNPFNAETIIEIRPMKGYGLEDRLEIYDILGRKVHSFEIDAELGGRYRWDGRDLWGNALPSGVYFCRAGEAPVLELILVR